MNSLLLVIATLCQIHPSNTSLPTKELHRYQVDCQRALVKCGTNSLSVIVEHKLTKCIMDGVHK